MAKYYIAWRQGEKAAKGRILGKRAPKLEKILFSDREQAQQLADENEKPGLFVTGVYSILLDNPKQYTYMGQREIHREVEKQLGLRFI